MVKKIIECNTANVGTIIMKLDNMTCQEVYDHGVKAHGRCVGESGACE
jgi:hypothetical protein